MFQTVLINQNPAIAIINSEKLNYWRISMLEVSIYKDFKQTIISECLLYPI